MKKLRAAGTLIALALVAVNVNAGWREDFKIGEIQIAPVAALRTDGLNGQSDFGAGLDLGIGVNKFVSLHATALAYETEDWRSATVDESEFYVRADLTKFSFEKFIPYFKGGGQVDWNEGDFGLGVGGGARIPFTKKQVFALGGDYTVRAWFSRAGKSSKDSVARAYLEIRPPGW